MPKYFDFKINGYYLYFTTHCVVEAMHAHASDGWLTEGGSAKFFVKSNGDTVVQNRGSISEADIRRLQRFIKDNYELMYAKWRIYSSEGFYRGE